MRPAVLVFAPLLLLPLLACESDLAGPEPDAAVTELQQPAASTADAAFQLGPQFGGDWWDDKHGFGYGGPHVTGGETTAADENAADGGDPQVQSDEGWNCPPDIIIGCGHGSTNGYGPRAGRD